MRKKILAASAAIAVAVGVAPVTAEAWWVAGWPKPNPCYTGPNSVKQPLYTYGSYPPSYRC